MKPKENQEEMPKRIVLTLPFCEMKSIVIHQNHDEKGS